MSKIAVILTLPSEYNTSSMLRSRAIIGAMVRLGHSVTCYMPKPDVNCKYYSTSLKIYGVEEFRYGKVIKNGSFAAYARPTKKTIKTRLLNFIYRNFKKVDVFGATLLHLPERKKISKDIKRKKFDYLVSFSDPITAHLIGKYVKKRNSQLIYVQQWGDPLASDTVSKTTQPVWLRKIVENSLLKPADRICYVSPFTNEEQKQIFPKQAKKMFFLPTPSLEYDEKISNEKEEKSICLGYFGSYYSVARNLVPFYKAAVDMPEANFLIIGDSDLELQSTANIQILQRVPQEELVKYINKIDVIVCLMNHKGNQIPGKVYHDASSKKDILFIKDGEYGDDIEKFFSKYNHYTFVNNSEEEISQAIREYLKNGVPVREPVEDFMSINIAANLLSTYKKEKQ